MVLHRSTSGDGARIPTPPRPRARPANKEQDENEMAALIMLCLPMLVTNLCQAVLPITSFAYAGRLTDATTLAGLGLGVSVCNISGVCIFYGMGSGIDVLCTQAFGAKNYRLVGVTFARGTLLTAFMFLPVAFLWYDMEKILLSLGQQPDVAHVTGTFARAYLWGMIPFTVFENLKRCLQAQNLVIPVMKVTLLGVLANVVFHHLTMVVLGMGVYGAGLALSLAGTFLLVTMIAYTWIFRLGEKGCWSGLCSKEIFHDWRKYLAVSIPGLLGLFIEWTSVEASTFLAGFLGDAQLETQIMILSAYAIAFQFALSICISANIRVGNLLGAGETRRARKSAWCGVTLAVIAAVLAGLGLGLGRRQWPRLYDVSEEVLDRIVDLTWIYVGAQMIDMGQNVCTGILKGMGKQRIQAWAAGIGFWGVGVPLSYYLGVHRGLGVKGLWCGMAAGEGPLFAFYLYVISSADWNKCAREAAERVGNESNAYSASGDSSTDLSDISDFSDSESAAGAEASATYFGAGDDGRIEDEETGHYGGVEMARVRALRTARMELDRGDSSSLVAAVAAVARRAISGGGDSSGGGGSSGGSDSDSNNSVDGLMGPHAGETSRLVAAGTAVSPCGGIGGVGDGYIV